MNVINVSPIFGWWDVTPLKYCLTRFSEYQKQKIKKKYILNFSPCLHSEGCTKKKWIAEPNMLKMIGPNLVNVSRELKKLFYTSRQHL